MQEILMCQDKILQFHHDTNSEGKQAIHKVVDKGLCQELQQRLNKSTAREDGYSSINVSHAAMEESDSPHSHTSLSTLTVSSEEVDMHFQLSPGQCSDATEGKPQPSKQIARRMDGSPAQNCGQVEEICQKSSNAINKSLSTHPIL